MSTPPSPFLVAALEAAEAAEEIIRHYWTGGVSVRTKADQTPVTVADVEAEQAIRQVITRAFPGHAFFGEETGHHGSGEYTWLVDPIDGTKSFVRGRPFFSTQIALMRGNDIVVGVSNAPVYGERAWAEKGRGAFLNGRPIGVSTVDDLAEAVLSSGNLKSLTRDPDRWCAFGALIRQVSTSRGFGDFLHYHLLATGCLDLVVESDVNILDVAALSVIVTEAGGTVTDFAGLPLSMHSTDIVASNARLHGSLLAALRSTDLAEGPASS